MLKQVIPITMKFLASIFLAVFSDYVKSSILELATSEMLLSSFRSITSHVDVQDFSNDSFEMNSFLLEFWDEKAFSVKVSTDVDEEKHFYKPKIGFCLLLFSTREEFIEKIDAFLRDRPLATNGYYVIVLTKDTKTNISVVFNIMWSKSFYNVAVLTKGVNNSTVELFTFFPFKSNHCNQAESEMINVYINDTWKKRIFFPEKFENFHKCQIKVGATEGVARFIATKFENGSQSFIGSDVDIMNGLAEVLNFKPVVNYSSTINNYGTVFDNGTSNGVISQLMTGDSDFIPGFFLHIKRAKFMEISKIYSFFPVLVMIPQGSPFTSFENLIRPFSPNVWICMISAAAFALIATFLMYRESFLTNGLVDRGDKQNCYLNLMIVVVGGSIVKAPKPSSQRIFSMSLILLCLVMRTVYQSKMFHFFQSGDSRKLIRSLQDMQEMEYNLYVTTTLNFLISDAIKYPEALVDFKL